MRVAVTGASGFIGGALISELSARGLDVQRVRSTDCVLSGVNCLIHCAARVHVGREAGLDSLFKYRRVNVEGTLSLARRAAAIGVRRFIFVSSIGVNGTTTYRSRRFSHVDTPLPVGHYATSKWEAEQGLREIASETGMEVVVLRPPLVYGPGAKGNIRRLVNLVRSGVPLPLASVANLRSFIGIDNLVDVLLRCIDHPRAAGHTFLVSDGNDLSTPQLVRMIANSMGCSVHLFPVPVTLIRFLGSLLGRLDDFDRLLGSMQIDNTFSCEILGWDPPVSVEEGIRRMVAREQII